MSDTIIDTIHEADVALSVEAGQLRDHPAVEALGFLSEISDQPPAFTLAAAAMAAGLLSRRSRLAEGGARALASLWLATQIKGRIKSAVVRTRPSKLLEEGHYETGVDGPDEHDYNSFPSGHSADAVAAARAISRVAPDARVPLMAAAGLVGLVQVPRAKHHLTDVLAGAVVGLVAEAAVNAVFDAARVRPRLRAALRKRGD